MKRYHVFDHTADLGVQVFAKTFPELFKNGAYALFDLVTDLYSVRPSLEREITVQGVDRDDLWVNYLRECLYIFQGERLLCSDYDIVTVEPGQVFARLRGEVFDPERHRIKQEIKAVTYHQASVRKTPRGWTGRVIFDV